MKFKFSSFFVALITVFAISAASFAQETKLTDNPAPVERNAERFGKWDKMRGGHRGSHHQGKMLRAFSELNLTDSQKQQISTIVETNKTATSAQREELKQLFVQRRRSGTELTPEQTGRARELGSQLREAGQKMHSDLLQILTPEQQELLKQKRAERRERHRERRQMKQQNGETTLPNN